MEIINEEKNIKCSNCKTNLNYTPKDIKTTFFVNMPYIECPICGNKIFIV